jgi:hypothetical protein
MRLSALVALGAALAAAVWLLQVPVAAQSLPAVTVTGVAPNNSSARIFYNPVAGANDYRAFDVTNPADVKYAGLAHYVPADNCPGSYCLHHFQTDSSGNVIYPYQIQNDGTVQSGANTVQDVPALDIEWNALNDTAPHTLVVQAVDALGPAPQHNLYPFACCDVHTAIYPPAGMLGSNKGSTPDGNTSTNGQGPYTNNPKVIAQSQPFVVQAQPSMTPLGKISGSSQQFLDTFDQSEASSVALVSQDMCGFDSFNNFGTALYSLNAGTAKAWSILVKSADFTDTMPFISNSHFMDMLFDGATAGVCSAPTDTTYSSLSMTPTKTANMSSGGILHLTMEVDAHQSFRRWLSFNLSPASDQIQSFGSGGGAPVNNTNDALFFETKATGATLSLFNGSVTPATAGCGPYFIANDFMVDGRGLDDRSRLDFFVSQTHYAFFEDNELVCQDDLPGGGISWFNQPLETYFSHYLYHSDADISDMRGFVLSGGTYAYPLNSYWFNDPQNGTASSTTSNGASYPPGYGFPHSDERHWDNMGFEVLPASAAPANDFSSFAQSVALTGPQAPQFSSGPLPTLAATATLTAALPATPTSTPTTPPTSTPTNPPAGSPPPPTGTGAVGVWTNVTPSNANLTASLDCGNFGASSVVVDPSNPSNYYARFDCQGTWRSTDFGQTWAGPIDATTGPGTAADCAGGFNIAGNGPGTAPTLYQSCIRGSGGFWRSTDGGVHWTGFNIGPAGNRQDVYPPVVDPYDHNHLLVTAHELNAIYQSFDGGQTWANVKMDPGMNAPGSAFVFFIDTGNAATTRSTWLWSAQGTGGTVGTWRTTDGSKWKQVDNNEHQHGGMQIYQPDTSGVVFMAGVYSQLGWGVLRSTDYGQTWTHVGFTTNENIVYGTQNNVYADSPSWEFAPQPGTGTWTQQSAAPVGATTAAVAFDGKNWVIVTSNATAGVWRYSEPTPDSQPSGGQTSPPTSSPTSTATPPRTNTPTPLRTNTPTLTPTNTPTPTPTNVATAQPTDTPTASPASTRTALPTSLTSPAPAGYASSAGTSPGGVARGGTISIGATVASSPASTVLIDLEVSDPAGRLVFQKTWDNQRLGGARGYSTSWLVPTTATPGTYFVAVKIYSPGGVALWYVYSPASAFNVT